MSRTLIVGAGDLAREIYNWILDAGQYVDGFLDDDPLALSDFDDYEVGVVGSIKGYERCTGDRLIMGINDPKNKLGVAELLCDRGATFVNYIDPEARISKRCQLGIGCVVLPRSVISCHARLGSFVTVNLFTTIGHDAVVGDGCTFSSHCDVTGHGCLGRGVFMGTHASVLPRVRVGDFAVIGAGSVAMGRVSQATTIVGVPGTRIAVAGRGL